jgi:hypothetical protein
MKVTLPLTLLFLLQGCIILPVPNRRVEGYGVTACVVDAQDGHPIANVRVVDATNARCFALTAPNGCFRLNPIVQWHAGYLWGVISYPIWPFTGDLITGDRTISITAPGYTSRIIEISSPGSSKEPTVETPVDFRNDYYLLANLPLHRMSGWASATAPSPAADFAARQHDP